VALRAELDHVAADNQAKVSTLHDRHRAGEIDEDQFRERSATVLNRGNAKATVASDRAVAAEKAKATQAPARPAGVRPISDKERLRQAVATTGEKVKPGPEGEAQRAERLRRLAKSEPYSTAQETITKSGKKAGATGWVRAVNPGACQLCRKWADGKVRPNDIRMVRHIGCTCLPRPAFLNRATKRKLKKKAGVLKSKAGVLLAASPADEVALTGAAGYFGRAAFLAARRRPDGPTIFDRMAQLERHLLPHGIELVKGEYMVHGSGLLDALNIRVAADLDVIAHPRLYDRIAAAPGWRRVMAGVEKDVEILIHPKLHMQVAKAVPETPSWRRQITFDDLENNTVTLRGREFIKPELLVEMKTAAMREGAKVRKNIRDIALLDGRLTWQEDVERFGNLLNRSRLTSTEQRAVAVARHPSATVLEQAEARAAALMRERGAGRRLKPIATIPERRALQRYGRGSFGLNKRLRAGTPLGEYETRLVAHIDTALAKQFTPHRVKVYRGLRMTKQEALDLYTPHIGGLPIQEKSFMSTGLREAVARKYGQSGVFLEIDVPAGTNGYFAPYRALTSQELPNKFLQAFGEDELLLPRGIPYRITELVRRSDGSILIKAEIVPAPPTPRFPGRPPGMGHGISVLDEAVERGIDLADESGALDLFAFVDDIQRGALWVADVVQTGFVEFVEFVAELISKGVALAQELATGQLFDRFLLAKFGPDFASNLPGAFVKSLLKSFTDPDDRLEFVSRLLDAGIGPRSSPADLWGFLRANPDYAKFIPDALHALPDAIREASKPSSRSAFQGVVERIFGPDATSRILDTLLGKLRHNPKRLLALFDTVTSPNLNVARFVKDYRADLASTVSKLARQRVVGGAGGRRHAARLLTTIRSERGSVTIPGGKHPKPPRISVAAPFKEVRKVKHRTLAPGVGPRMGPELIEDRNVPKTIERQSKVPGFEDFAGRTDRAALNEIIDRQADNILRAAERSWAVSPAAVDLHATWYPFAHTWLTKLADAGKGRHGVSRPGAYAAAAALSPGADWADNIAWAKRVLEAFTKDLVVDERWIDAIYATERAKGGQLGRKGGPPRRRAELIGKRLSELEVDNAAYALRGMHDFDPTRQLGGHAGFGNPDNKTVPQSLENLQKAVAVLRDGSLENIDATLGGMKVRSFYSNLAHPWDIDDINVTVDTHHYGIANGAPWTVSHRFLNSTTDVSAVPYSGATGVGGTYPLVVEATRRATALFNATHGTKYLPHQLQSIVWEQWRADFPPRLRTPAINSAIEAIRTDRALGRITAGEAADAIELVRLRYGAPRVWEIAEWFDDDLAGRVRRKLTDMRKLRSHRRPPRR
jgi:hypothetical protein